MSKNDFSRWECKLVQSLWRKVREFLIKLKIELPWSPEFRSRYLSKRKQNRSSKRYLHTCAHLSIIQNNRTTPRCGRNLSVHQRMNKEEMKCVRSCTRTHKGISFSHKKEGNSAVWSNVNGSWGYYAKWGQSHRNRIEKWLLKAGRWGIYIRRDWWKGYIFLATRWMRSETLMCNIVTTLNCFVLYHWKLQIG